MIYLEFSTTVAGEISDYATKGNKYYCKTGHFNIDGHVHINIRQGYLNQISAPRSAPKLPLGDKQTRKRGFYSNPCSLMASNQRIYTIGGSPKAFRGMPVDTAGL